MMINMNHISLSDCEANTCGRQRFFWLTFAYSVDFRLSKVQPLTHIRNQIAAKLVCNFDY